MTDSDQTMTIQEAATRLGITPEAVRKRVQRGTLRGHKSGRTWYVVLSDRPDSDQTRPPADQTRLDATDPLAEAYRAHIASLERQLAERGEELRRKDIIIQSFAQRLPELPPPDEAKPKKRKWWPWRG